MSARRAAELRPLPVLRDDEHVIRALHSHAAGRYEVLEGDAFEVLRCLPTGCADLVFADAPYFLSNGGETCIAGKRAPVQKGPWDESAGVTADHQFHRRWLQACRRVLKPQGTLWASGTHHAILSIGWAAQAAGWHTLNLVTWYKPSSPPNLGCRQLTHSCEQVLWLAPERHDPLEHWFDYAEAKRIGGGKQLRDFWELPSRAGKAETAHGRHPTMKPLALLDRIVRLSAPPDGLVLDPFAGSGTSGAAALALGRRFIGIEIDPGYADLAARRCSAACSR